MNPDAQTVIDFVQREDYVPMKVRALGRALHVRAAGYPAFRQMVRALLREGRLALARGRRVVPAAASHRQIGVFRSCADGHGFVRLLTDEGQADVYVPANHRADAATGDRVEIELRPAGRGRAASPAGRVVRVVHRAQVRFVGTYLERGGLAVVRPDGHRLQGDIEVGDPGARGVRRGDKVVVQMVRWPTPAMPGQGVIVEVLGPAGRPGVDTLSVVRQFDLPEAFPPEVLEEAQAAVEAFDPDDRQGREDFTHLETITIDPADAQDFDDAVSLERRDDGSWRLGVHIADVAHFVPAGGPMDEEARRRGTSVYLPGRTLPMLPEVISNGLASLQPRQVRYARSVLMDFDAAGRRTGFRVVRSVIRVMKRLTYEQALALLEEPPREGHGPLGRVQRLLGQMRSLALVLRQARLARGALELSLPEVHLTLDRQGVLVEATPIVQDVSHQIIEEFMLAANETVAGVLAAHRVPFLRRVHAAPAAKALAEFAAFAQGLGLHLRRPVDRAALQHVLAQVEGRPHQQAVHLALLKSLARAEYRPAEMGHYALASDCYCHFTSPIRRYPDLTVHRLLDRLSADRPGPRRSGPGADLLALAEHCTFTERRAEEAERELTKLKILAYLQGHVGQSFDGLITGVEDYGLFVQLERFLIEGLAHVSCLGDDYYQHDRTGRRLVGRRRRQQYRLGDRVRVTVAGVDLARRQLDLELERTGSRGARGAGAALTKRRRW